VGLAQADDVAVVLAGHQLSDEQQAMVAGIATSGAGVEVVVGKAGAGKTPALAAAAEAWRVGGVPVIGTAVAARTALTFGEQAGVPAMTVTRLLAALDKPVGGPAGLARGSVLIVDEAGMLGTRPLARLLAHVEAADAKLVLVGDHRQLPELEAGGAFRSLASTLGAVELSQNRRQVQAWERSALDELCGGTRPERWRTTTRPAGSTERTPAPTPAPRWQAAGGRPAPTPAHGSRRRRW
jgi:ATP-dependent exoDNAse (exonuclease V) alpha subunit